MNVNIIYIYIIVCNLIDPQIFICKKEKTGEVCIVKVRLDNYLSCNILNHLHLFPSYKTYSPYTIWKLLFSNFCTYISSANEFNYSNKPLSIIQFFVTFNKKKTCLNAFGIKKKLIHLFESQRIQENTW